MKLVKGASSYTIPAAYYPALTKFEASIRTDEVDRAGTHGSIMTGDGQVESRTVEVDVDIVGTTAAQYITAKNALLAAAYRQDQKLYIDDTRYINVASLKKFTEEFYDGRYLEWATITLAFLATDPFLYSDTVTTVETTITTSPQTISVTNSGGVDVPPIITVTPSAANPSMTIVNDTDDDMTLSYTDASFLPGNVLVIDNEEGTVERDGTSTLNNYAGDWLRLVPGANSIIYTGALGTVTFVYTERWL